MERSLEPELLDSLGPNDPAALHNRRDLRWTNLIMRNHAWLEHTVASQLEPGERVLEVGAGTGEFGMRLASLRIGVDGLDLWPRPATWPDSAAWHQADLRSFTEWERYPVIVGNLIWHQFSNAELAAVGAKLQGARVIIACEPMRRRVSQVLYRTVAPLLGANEVTLHDAHVSIAAGFLGDELPRALGLDPARWAVRCTTTVLGAYHLIARRRT